jgi:DNA-binding MarR family transcriptional regulator
MMAVKRKPLSQTRALDGVLPYQLRRAQEASFNAFARRVGDSHVWPGWYALVVIIHDNPGINQSALSSASGRDKSTLTASLRELGKAGLIRRTPDRSDRRSYRLALTARGRAHLKALRVHARLHDRLVDAIVGRSNKAVLTKLLKTLADELNRR